VQAQGAELAPQRGGKAVGTVRLVGQRRDLGAREAAHGRAHLVERLAQAEVEVAGVESGHGGCSTGDDGAIVGQ
jgi:hypothetical protein